ncbi:bifunctional 3-demethylubiquinone-9 3-methyltransferase/ 2-octaprenyl-6-hydroxy phenol methylase [Marinobacterium sp. xm-g-59]|uniref:class I SAM-dependent methyltransferase n=1 Tax=Marinobacterium sp. xm-g-59 TaxID=2497748 RepID=UPI001569D089|nr:class I SAM-dependent methyltransferase [Marinobacterium sp. xm-g-59]NRP95475.1 bifunctional 3-demethylubiquinone-9 3-methyltransferase/ 2-octaprenyl-6-hydroxy phenol methylase [Marinobacterium sp. xm-g-59]
MKGTWYLNEQLDFDRRLIEYRYRSIKNWFKGGNLLELGPAEGVMTRLLVKDFKSVVAVDGSQDLINEIPEIPNLKKICSYFENYEPNEKFDTIIMEHILEHVDDPVALLKRAKKWLSPEGVIIAGVPNGDSIHRLAAVEMGLLESKTQLNDRDHKLGHQRVYTMESFVYDIVSAGMDVKYKGGVFFKPLSNGQIEKNWTDEMMDAFYSLGKQFPDHCAEIFIVCQNVIETA